MAALLADPSPRLLTAEEFLQIDFGHGLKAELDNGYIRVFDGGTRRHSQIRTNVLVWLGNALGGSGAHAYATLGVKTHDRSLRYPDVAVDGGTPRDRPDDRYLSAPRIIVEVLSPVTRQHDIIVKANEYRAIPTLDTLVFIDPDDETISVHQRIENGWTESLFSDSIDIALPSLDLTIPRLEIFADD